MRASLTLLLVPVALISLVCVGIVAAMETGKPEGPPKDATDGSSGGKPLATLGLEGQKPQYPIKIPPASQVRALLRQQETSEDASERAEERQVKARGPVQIRFVSPIHPAGQSCDRAIPTRQEFLSILKNRPADANQIVRRCPVNLRNISPLRQLPVATRQLPEDTRQRPVGTWGR